MGLAVARAQLCLPTVLPGRSPVQRYARIWHFSTRLGDDAVQLAAVARPARDMPGIASRACPRQEGLYMHLEQTEHT